MRQWVHNVKWRQFSSINFTPFVWFSITVTYAAIPGLLWVSILVPQVSQGFSRHSALLLHWNECHFPVGRHSVLLCRTIKCSQQAVAGMSATSLAPPLSYLVSALNWRKQKFYSKELWKDITPLSLFIQHLYASLSMLIATYEHSHVRT